jgi:outer membrane protein assembly factor BamA
LKKFLFIFTCFSLSVSAQLIQDTSKNLRYLILPAVFRAPETGWAYGLSGTLSFKTSHRNDSLTRTSTIQALGIWTQRGQNIQALDATIYFPKEKYILYFSSSHSYFPDKFWGIGSETKNDWIEKYVYEQFNIYTHIKRKVSKHLFTGIILDYQNVFKINYDVGGNFDTTFFYGKSPYIASGIGASLSYDTRNATFWPTKGIFFQTQFTGYNKTFGSYYDFTKWTIDLRFFQKVFQQHVIAAQLYSYNTFGPTPLRNLANIGGESNMRGFYRGRLRDNNLITLIGEYRAVVYKRIALVAFGGIGNVFNQYSDLQKYQLKYSYGGGIRLSILENDRMNIRIDYGFYDKYNSGFYFTLGECF